MTLSDLQHTSRRIAEQAERRIMERHQHPAPAVVVKRHTYRGREGWLVYERRVRCTAPLCFARGWPTRIFSASEQEARRMADEIRRGLSPLFDDQIARLVSTGNASMLRAAGYNQKG